MFRNPADILNYGGIKCYPVYWVRTRGRVVAGSKYYLNKNKNNKNKSRIAFQFLETWDHHQFKLNVGKSGRLAVVAVACTQLDVEA